MTAVDWPALRDAAFTASRRAYAPYSDFPVGVAGLVDDGRVVVGCNVENASYGVTLCAECGLVSSLHATGGGRLVAVACVDRYGEPLMPCGRCRQLLWEHGGPELLVDGPERPLTMTELLPHAFDVLDLRDRAGAPDQAAIPSQLRHRHGEGTVFVHPDLVGETLVWTAYWERSETVHAEAPERGIWEEGPIWDTPQQGIDWGRARTGRVIVVESDGTLFWAGRGEPPDGVEERWE